MSRLAQTEAAPTSGYMKAGTQQKQFFNHQVTVGGEGGNALEDF